MGRGLLLRRHLAATFPTRSGDHADVCGISNPFGLLSPIEGQIIHALLTRAPLYSRGEPLFLARLACVRPAANVRSEPGSNSPLKWMYVLHPVPIPPRGGPVDWFLPFLAKTHNSFSLFSFQRPTYCVRGGAPRYCFERRVLRHRVLVV